MKMRNIKVFILIAIFSTNLHAAENNSINTFTLISNKDINVNDEWISINSKENTPVFSLQANTNVDQSNEVAFAWNLSDSFAINLSLFENPLNFDIQSNYTSLPYSNKNFTNTNNKGFNKLVTQYQTPPLENNRNISGYKFGISSKFGMGKNTVLNIGFDYGQLEDANLAGFNSPEINTSSFALGFRREKFGASFLTDTYLEENTDMVDNTRLGIELDWYFSDQTTISFGSKQRINNSQSNISNSLESFTGDVQYIKFQHNL